MKKENLNNTKNRMIHIRLPDDLHKRVRICAAEADQTIQDWVVAALQSEMEQQDRERRSS